MDSDNGGWSDKETREDMGNITSLEVEEMEEGGTKWIGKITSWYGHFLVLYPYCPYILSICF